MAKGLSFFPAIPQATLVALFGGTQTYYDDLAYVTQPCTELPASQLPVHAVCLSDKTANIAQYNGFPIGSTILFVTSTSTARLYVKTDTTTWKYQAIAT